MPQEENPALRKKAERILPADIKSKRVQHLIKEMKELLSKEEYGVALAAPQVGESVRLFIVSGRALARGTRNAPDEPTLNDLSAKDGPVEMVDQVYINPEFVKVSRAKKEKHEGCLSIRGKWGTVLRAEKATIRAYNEHGKRFTRGASDFLAHIFQHEMDHLEGILYIDKARSVFDDTEKL